MRRPIAIFAVVASFAAISAVSPAQETEPHLVAPPVAELRVEPGDAGDAASPPASFASVTKSGGKVGLPCPSDCCPCDSCRHGLLRREKLFGDWMGHRTCLAQQGIMVDASLTQFYQGVADGGNEQVFRYGSKLDLYIMADTGAMGLWRGGAFQIHAVDWQFGQNSNLDAVTLAPVNTNLLTPRAEESFALSTLLYQHNLGGGYAVSVGRTSALDLWSVLYPDYGRGVDGFMNTSILLPLNVVPSTPLTMNMAGILKAGERGVEAGLLVLESNNVATTTGLDFPNGVTILGIARKYTDFGCLPGSHTLVGGYATGDYTSFDTSGWTFVPGGGITPAQNEGTWVAAYLAEQRLWMDPCNAQRYGKLFGKVGFSDTENSPFEWTASLAYESFGGFDCRPNDRWGIGYFYTGLNGQFANLFPITNPLRDVHGTEIYYNAQIAPWFHLTADVQVIRPARAVNDTAIVVGLRAKIDF